MGCSNHFCETCGSTVATYFVANPYINIFMSMFGLVQSSFAIPVPGVIIIAVAMIVVSFVFALLQSGRIKNIEPYQMMVEE